MARVNSINARMSHFERVHAIKRLQEQQRQVSIARSSVKLGATSTRSNFRASLISGSPNAGMRRFDAVSSTDTSNQVSNYSSPNSQIALNSALNSKLRPAIVITKQPKFIKACSLSALKSKRVAAFTDSDDDGDFTSSLPISSTLESTFHQSDSQNNEYSEETYEEDVKKYNLFNALDKHEDKKISSVGTFKKNTSKGDIFSEPIEVGEKMNGVLMQKRLWQKLEGSRKFVTSSSLI